MSLDEMRQQYSEQAAELEVLQGLVSKSKEAVIRSLDSNLPEHLQQQPVDPEALQALGARLDLVNKIRAERVRVNNLADVGPMREREATNQTRIRYRNLIAERLGMLFA